MGTCNGRQVGRATGPATVDEMSRYFRIVGNGDGPYGPNAAEAAASKGQASRSYQR